MKKVNVLHEMLQLFKDESGQVLDWTPTQKEIYDAITLKKNHRVGVIAPTQYGKSEAASVGIVVAATALPESWTIIGGTKAKASLIMQRVIDHIFDHDIFSSQLKIDGSLEKLRRERRRDHLTFRRGGSIRILSAEFRNRRAIGKALLGEGSKNIIIDDSVLCDDEQYAFIKRMVGGHKHNFLIELANPLKRNHFHRVMHSKLYHKIWIDYTVALAEGRYTEDYIAEMRKEKFFDIFYECRFPASDVIDEAGYMRLLTDEEIEAAFVGVGFDPRGAGTILSGDIGRGGAYNCLIARKGNEAKVIRRDHERDLMATAGNVVADAHARGVLPRDIHLDDIGVGGGVVDRVREVLKIPRRKDDTLGVLFGSTKCGQEFANVKAECFWDAREWIRAGGKLDEADEDLKDQLKILRYKHNSSGKIQMEPKENLALNGIPSPDDADALALSFAKTAPEGKVYVPPPAKKETSRPATLREDQLRDHYKRQINDGIGGMNGA